MVRIRQYAYFALSSQLMTPDDMTKNLGMAPDEVRVRADRLAEPPRPAAHVWRVVCRHRGRTVDEQISDIVTRLTPITAEIGRLARILAQNEGDRAGARLQVVRYFGDDDGEDEEPVVVGDLEKLAGQHQLLGWHLDRAVLDFLQAAGADLDVDEYG
jgi:hypothetical protein